MSSFVRTIQRTTKRARFNINCLAPHFNGRGSKLGVKNPKDACLIARLAREKRNKARRNL